jgi:hypothetical protein
MEYMFKKKNNKITLHFNYNYIKKGCIVDIEEVERTSSS